MINNHSVSTLWGPQEQWDYQLKWYFEIGQIVSIPPHGRCSGTFGLVIDINRDGVRKAPEDVNLMGIGWTNVQVMYDDGVKWHMAHELSHTK